jgi:ribosomal protein S11
LKTTLGSEVGFGFASLNSMSRIAFAGSLLLALSAVACASEVDGNRDQNFSEVGRADLGNGGGSTSGTGTNGGGTGTGTTGSTTGTTGSGTGTSTAGFTISTTSSALTADLYDMKTVEVTVNGTGGFAGDVTLALEGIGAEVDAKLDKTKLKAGEKAKLTIYSKQAGPNPFTIKATSGTLAAQNQAMTFAVAKTLTMHLKMGTQMTPKAPDVWSPGMDNVNSQYRVLNASPLVVKVINDDTTPHIVHGNGAFAHGSTAVALPKDGSDPTARTITGAQTVNGYVHEIGAGASTNFSITIVN